MAKITTTQPPPQDLDSEEALLGAIIDHPHKLFDIRSLLDEGEVFYKLEHQEYYAAILAVFDAGKTIRPLTIIQELRKTGKGDLLTAFHPDYLRNQGIGLDTLTTALHLRELYIKRLALSQSRDLIQSVLKAEPLDDQIALVQKMAETLSGKMAIVRDKPTSYYVSRTLSMIHDASKVESGLIGINTGSGKLNKLTGGWRPGKLIIIAARPAQGKTAVALHHAISAAIDGTHVGFLSAEMSNEELILRLISSRCFITYEELSNGRFDSGQPFREGDWDAIHKAAGFVEKLPIHFYDGDNYDIGNVIYWVLDLIRRFGLGLFIADYIQILEDKSIKGGDMRLIVASVSRKLKLLSKTMQIPVIALSQLGRNVDQRENKRPMLGDLKESGQLEQDADMVVGLYRDDSYKLEEAKKKQPFIPPNFDKLLDYDFLKYRGGRLRMVRLGIDIGTNRIADEPTFFFSPQLPIMPPREGIRDFSEPLQKGEEGF